MASKQETINKVLIAKYKEDKPKSEFVMVQYTDEYDLSTLKAMRRHALKYKQKTFHIKDITPIQSDFISSFSFGLKTVKWKKDYVESQDMTGLFKIDFSNGDIMYYAKWLSGGGRSKSVEGMFASEKSTWYKFLTLLNKQRKRRSRPKPGVYRAFMENVGAAGGFLAYKKMDKLVETPVVHHATETLVEDMDFFFDNMNLFTRYGMPGTRKAMLVGEPGTGKSSICTRLAKKYLDTKSVVFVTDLSSAASHLMSCAKHNISTVVFLEDAESTLGNANSSVLNFLDGIDQPVNKAGAYIVMTTNYPQRIEPRILKRPGRVDRVIKFDALKGNYALECAEIYFKDILFFEEKTKAAKDKGRAIRKKLITILDNDGKGMTGAQIKELAQSSIAYALTLKEEVVDIDMVIKTKSRMEKDLKDVYKYADEDSLHGYDPVGFKTEREAPVFAPQEVQVF